MYSKLLFVGVFLVCSLSFVKQCGFYQQSKGLDNKSENNVDNSSDSFSSSKNGEPQLDSLIDFRDGQKYAVILIGEQTWMAESLRFETPDSWLNPDNPSHAYGRLYSMDAAQSACPLGWHLPTDQEWNQLELTLGLPIEKADEIGWRGAHGVKMKSRQGWINEGDGTNSSGFNAFPTGFYYEESFEGGLGASSGFWSAKVKPNLLGMNDLMDEVKNGAWVRFLAAPHKGVNRFFDDNTNPSSWGLACRCIKD